MSTYTPHQEALYSKPRKRPVIVIASLPSGESWLYEAFKHIVEEGYVTLIVDDGKHMRRTQLHNACFDEYHTPGAELIVTELPKYKLSSIKREKLEKLTAELNRAKAMRNKHLIKELEKRIKRL